VDNIVSNLHLSALQLTMHSRIFQAAVLSYRALRRKWWGIVAIAFIMALMAVWLLSKWQGQKAAWTALAIGLLICIGLVFAARIALRHRNEHVSDPRYLDELFEAVYRRELAMQDRTDLRILWLELRNPVGAAIRLVGLNSVPLTSLQNQVRRLVNLIDQEVLPLRRDVAQYHRRRNWEPPTND
jgi:hypothetical protein